MIIMVYLWESDFQISIKPVHSLSSSAPDWLLLVVIPRTSSSSRHTGGNSLASLGSRAWRSGSSRQSARQRRRVRQGISTWGEAVLDKRTSGDRMKLTDGRKPIVRPTRQYSAVERQSASRRIDEWRLRLKISGRVLSHSSMRMSKTGVKTNSRKFIYESGKF